MVPVAPPMLVAVPVVVETSPVVAVLLELDAVAPLPPPPPVVVVALVAALVPAVVVTLAVAVPVVAPLVAVDGVPVLALALIVEAVSVAELRLAAPESEQPIATSAIASAPCEGTDFMVK